VGVLQKESTYMWLNKSAMTSDGRYLYAGVCKDLQIWDTTTYECLHTVLHVGDPVSMGDGRLLCWDRRDMCWIDYTTPFDHLVYDNMSHVECGWCQDWVDLLCVG
jgi:hypothetical protein